MQFQSLSDCKSSRVGRLGLDDLAYEVLQKQHVAGFRVTPAVRLCIIFLGVLSWDLPRGDGVGRDITAVSRGGWVSYGRKSRDYGLEGLS